MTTPAIRAALVRLVELSKKHAMASVWDAAFFNAHAVLAAEPVGEGATLDDFRAQVKEEASSRYQQTSQDVEFDAFTQGASWAFATCSNATKIREAVKAELDACCEWLRSSDPGCAHPGWRRERAARLYRARWGRPAAPAAPETPAEALAARPLLEQVARLGDCIGANTVAQIIAISSRAAAWLEENPPGQPVAIEPRGCPTPGACSCVEPAAPAASELGKLGELVKWLEEEAEAYRQTCGTNLASVNLARAATLLSQQAAPSPAVVPVEVSERPWEWEGWCNAEGQCWALSPDHNSWQLVKPRFLSFWVLLLPHHAIPLPQDGEEEA